MVCLDKIAYTLDLSHGYKGFDLTGPNPMC